jgi:hypothetical protein
VVLAREDTPGDQRLVAYVVPREQAPSFAELKAHLSQALPPYMVPAAYVFLETLPLTSSGKVDRKALPVPERSGANEASYVAPRTPTEEILGEIEAVLAEHPEVRQAAVHLWRVKANDVRIVACCVLAKARVFAPISLRKHMRARLPEYVPQHFLLVEEIPLTPNGKVDRSKLPTPVVSESGIGQHEAPADPVEATIAEIWTKLVHPARPIGRADKFFEMGGHSLLALRALRQMEHQLGVRLDFRALFQETLADIATRCRSQRTAQGGGDGGAARPVALPGDTGLKERVTQASCTS